MHGETLFNSQFINDFINKIEDELIEEIKSFENNENINLENEKSLLLEKYKLGPLKLGSPKPSKAVREKKSEKDEWDDYYEREIFAMKIQLPFEGNGNLFFCRPSKCHIVFPKVESVNIKKKIIFFTIELDKLDEGIYKNEVKVVINNIETFIPYLNDDITPWDDDLERFIDTQFEKFKYFIKQKNTFYEKIGLTINPQADSFITPSPITRRDIPKVKLKRDKNIDKIHPRIKDEIYSDIISTLNNVGKAIEKKPSLYKNKLEEDLRDIFLLFLETRYESTTATGETFNKKGRTDILLKYSKDGSNLFVGECKFWKGVLNLHKTIDQILNYLTWRDSKSAILLFIDNKNIYEVKQKVKSEIKKYKNYKKTIQETDESYSYIIGLLEDKSVDINLEILFFHFPDRK